MGRVYVGELGFDNLKEAQDYAVNLKADPNYVPPVKEEVLAPGEGDTNSPFVPPTGPFFDPQEPGQEPDDLAMGMDEAAPGTDKTVETPVESNTVEVETGLEFETKELKVDPETVEVHDVSIVTETPAEPEFMPDNYEDMSDKQKEDHDLDTQQAIYESSTDEEKAEIDATNEAFDKEHKINDFADDKEDYGHHDALAEEGLA